MNPRLSYYGEGKERTMKVGDRVTVEGKQGEISHECQALKERWHVAYEGVPGTCCVSARECIPVEPERVKGECTIPGHQRCTGTPGCEFCNTCYWWHPAPSPGLLQRMGMATWPTLEQRIEALENILINGVPLKHCTKLTGGLR